MEVLQPVPRRRRRRHRRLAWRRLSPVLALLLIALAAGAVVGARSRAGGLRTGAAAAGRKAAPARREEAPRRTAAGRREALVAGPALSTRPLPALTAPAAIVVDERTGRVVWERRPHERREIASTTKIMTALLALRKLGPHDVVTVPPEAPRVPLVREGLRTGERVQAWKLFYALLLYSGNDDALTLGVATAGTKKAFIAEMNAEAERLGLRDTHYTSTSGVIDRGNYSSAWDLAALTRVALRNARFRRIVRTPRIEVPWAAPTYAKVYLNKNLLLGMYPGANGVKTGYTHLSGPCIVASATRRGVSLIAVALDSADEYVDAERLLDLGFRTLGA